MLRQLIITTFLVFPLSSCYNINNLPDSDKNTEIFNFSSWYGLYEYSNYQTDKSTGTGIGESYTLNLKKNKCNVDIVGYQIDKHFSCYLETTTKPNYINIYDLDKKIKFGEVKHTGADGYLIKITYFDEYNESNNNFYPLEKK